MPAGRLQPLAKHPWKTIPQTAKQAGDVANSDYDHVGLWQHRRWPQSTAA